MLLCTAWFLKTFIFMFSFQRLIHMRQLSCMQQGCKQLNGIVWIRLKCHLNSNTSNTIPLLPFFNTKLPFNHVNRFIPVSQSVVRQFSLSLGMILITNSPPTSKTFLENQVWIERHLHFWSKKNHFLVFAIITISEVITQTYTTKIYTYASGCHRPVSLPLLFLTSLWHCKEIDSSTFY